VDVGFEASVGGGIPVIRALTEGLAGNTLQSIYGIINGTSNYILSRMTHDGHSFETVLKDAQQAGYAEADPTFDVGGIDSAHKLAILVSLAYGTPVNFKEIYTEGITHITPTDIAYAKEFGFTIKLLGIAKLVDGEVEARVHPTMLSSASPIAQVEGVYNAIQLVGDAVGDVVLYGRGAGAMPTGSAVVSDVIAIGRNLLKGAVGRVPPASFQQDQRRPLRMKPMEEISSLYYLRFMVVDRPGVLAQIAGELGRCGISISSMLQQGRREGQTVPVVIKTHMARERDVQTALREINRKPFVSEPATLIRVEGKDE
jgi:homoserine dehydrogenase